MTARRPAWADESVVVAVPDPMWITQAADLARSVEQALHGWLAASVEHVGSTAVAGLAAKPIIDLAAGVGQGAMEGEADQELQSLGWELVPPELDDREWRRFFVLPRGDQRAAHLHLMDPAHHRWGDMLAFRDALRRHPLLRRRYAELKRVAAEALRDDREAYTDAKTVFVTEVLRSVGRGG